MSRVPTAPHSTTRAEPIRVASHAEQRDGDELQQAADRGGDQQVLEAEAELLHAVVDRVGVHQRVRADAEQRGADRDEQGPGAPAEQRGERQRGRAGLRRRRSRNTGVSSIDQRR